jgi:CRP/FNR family transcriptional regulator, anaerobic regulatory protein
MSALEHYIQSYFGVTQEDLAHISSYFEPASLKKGEHYLRAGQHADRLGFVQAGIVREYVQVSDRRCDPSGCQNSLSDSPSIWWGLAR